LTTTTPNLGLIVDSDITATSRQNLYKIDQLGEILTPQPNGDTLFSADADLRFTSAAGAATFGTADTHLTSFTIYANAFRLIGASSIPGLNYNYTDLNFSGSSLTSIEDYAAVISSNVAVSAAYTHISRVDNPHQTTAAQTGAYTTTQTDTLLSAKASTTDLNSHISNTSNPHSTTAAQTGAYSTTQVDNLLSSKADSSNLAAHVNASSSVHGISGSVVGTTESQVHSGKTISAAANSITHINNA
jgi:hypothetical protein